jgi:hypothetical protein
MRFFELLLEYNRDITVKNTNPNNILNALKNDDSIALTPELEKLRKQLRSNDEIKPDQIPNLVEIIVAAIEQKDPTNHKEYTPWLVRMYSKGNVKYEDLNRMNMLGLYDIGKKRKIIRPEHKDINKFKTYQEFEDVMFNNYPPDSFEKEEEQENSIAKKVFEDNDVLVVIPENETAACKYGKGTRWCTAATRGTNYFDSYNALGPLYILIPKKPKYNNEKYQLHFATNTYMDENDTKVCIVWLLTKRFPGLYDFFVKIEPNIQYNLNFMTADDVEKIFVMVKNNIIKTIEDWREKDKFKDKEYLKFLEYEGYIDDDGDIDWERVEDSDNTYENFNPAYDEAIEFINKELHPRRLWDPYVRSTYSYENMQDIRKLPYYMENDMFWLLNHKGHLLDYPTYKLLVNIKNYIKNKKIVKTLNKERRLIG